MICRSLPMQQQRRDNVDDIELSLLQHQLALFSHLEESVPPEVCHDLLPNGKHKDFITNIITLRDFFLL